MIAQIHKKPTRSNISTGWADREGAGTPGAQREVEKIRDLVEARVDVLESFIAELCPALAVRTGPCTAGLCYYPVETLKLNTKHCTITEPFSHRGCIFIRMKDLSREAKWTNPH